MVFYCLTRLWYDKNMEANEYYDFEDRRYVNPTISRDEQMAFIDNLRNTQTANNEQIQTDTYNLGTHIPATQGGLATGATSPDSYFMQRYQTPQVDTEVATLKATAQAQALNDVLSNYQKQVKKRYSDAYRAYNKRKGRGGGGGYNPTTTNGGNAGDVITRPLEDATEAKTDGGKISTDPWSDRNTTSYTKDGKYYTVDTDTNRVLSINGHPTIYAIGQEFNEQLKEAQKFSSTQSKGRGW